MDKGLDPKKLSFTGKSALAYLLHRDHTSDDDIEMAKLLMDNGLGSEQERNLFYLRIYNRGPQYDHYRNYDDLPLKVAVSQEETLYILAYSNKENRYTLSAQDAAGNDFWEYPFEGRRFFNILDNPAGLYWDRDRLLLAQNRYRKGRQYTWLGLFSPKGKLLAQKETDGVFESLVITQKGYALRTKEATAFFNRELALQGNQQTYPGAFVPAVSIENARDALKRRDIHKLIKTAFFPDRTELLYQRTGERIESYYVAQAASSDITPGRSSMIGGNGTAVLDFTQSPAHTYFILALPGQAVIQKRTREMGIKTYRYLDAGREPFDTEIHDFSCDESGCSVAGSVRYEPFVLRTYPDGTVQNLTRPLIDNAARTVRRSDAPEWRVVRSGKTDLIEGPVPFRVENGRLASVQSTIPLEEVHVLERASDHTLYAAGSHGGFPALEILRPDGTLKAHFRFDLSGLRGRITALAFFQDGSLGAVGNLQEGEKYRKNFALRMRPDGTVMWSRMYHGHKEMQNLAVSADAARLFTVADGSALLALSAKDGSIQKNISAKALRKLLVAPGGELIGIADVPRTTPKNSRSHPFMQSTLYCLSPDLETYRAHLAGVAGDRISDMQLQGDTILALTLFATHGSALSPAVLGRIDPKSCQIDFDWSTP